MHWVEVDEHQPYAHVCELQKARPQAFNPLHWAWALVIAGASDTPLLPLQTTLRMVMFLLGVGLVDVQLADPAGEAVFTGHGEHEPEPAVE